VSQVSDSDLLHIFPVAIIVIAMLLGLVLRSLVAPAYLIASVALSYLAAFGLSVLLFQIIGGTGGLNYFIPFLMFVFLLALGEDWRPRRYGQPVQAPHSPQKALKSCDTERPAARDSRSRRESVYD
jgi:hypothetical protein